MLRQHCFGSFLQNITSLHVMTKPFSMSISACSVMSFFFVHSFFIFDFLLTPGCWKCCAKIAQSWPRLCKKALGATLHMQKGLCRTSDIDQNK